MANRFSVIQKFKSLTPSSKAVILLCIPTVIFFPAVDLWVTFFEPDLCCPTVPVTVAIDKLNGMENLAWANVKVTPTAPKTDEEMDAVITRNYWNTDIAKHCIWDQGYPLPSGGLVTCDSNRRYILSRTNATLNSPAHWKEYFLYYSHRRPE